MTAIRKASPLDRKPIQRGGLPLKLNKYEPGIVYDADGWMWATIHDCQKDRAEKAALIVRACNAHADLLAACKAQLNILDQLIDNEDISMILVPEQLIHDARIAAISAIAQVEEAQ